MMKPEKSTITPKLGSREKKPYIKPSLVRFGDIRTLTLSPTRGGFAESFYPNAAYNVGGPTPTPGP